ncbi:chitobiosyldiphosphodolichol beta-1,4 mannosyltransferase [Aspergillus glaucus CBS 516.65]|uniref:Chitobiosyldiphosphodolichol beta-mannosyltransferase n=1 Tax=Aspergillus glaucus CBS 516.65 TaxID=1160497 RepID=A0A1L9V3Q0_ASPGL|nr:hypothetical protein ASPGLDRAFT_40787 [Aspergillus glaucus CBS 516.65]OJJ78459.1 hypothetical protein ASPGLDRAFT_40787 [Aspergillus glaucus CBS 516.65]
MIEVLISLAFYASTATTFLILLLPSQYKPRQASDSKQNASPEPKTRIQILVLGDVGRSPRMQYHALSVAKHGGQVDIIGYHESELHPDISSSPRITIVPIPPHPAFLQTSNKLLFLFFAPLKVIFQVLSLWRCLAYRTEPAKWLLVQNPPSIPTLAIASLVRFLRHTHLVVDWHNFGYSILALKLGGSHPVVRFSKWFERVFCNYATAHLCVTEAMTSVLKKDFALEAPILPLHDRPASHLQPIPDTQVRQEFINSLPETASAKSALGTEDFRVLVSSTSWTPDEDFSLLIDALCEYSKLATTTKPSLPPILAIITGKGPQKEMYLKKISDLEKAGHLQKVSIRTAWLSTENYAKLLASASLGVSLHTSSSGVDLPMKVVDMFGAGLPVVGWNRFEAWPELVMEGVNGSGFGSVGELVEQLVDLFGDSAKLEKLRAGALQESGRRWDDEWDPVAGKLLGLL